MPLKAIKSVLDEDPERARALVELEDRILDRALAGERTRTSAAEVRKRYGVPKEVLDRLEELEMLSPNSRGYSPSDVKIIEAIGRFRAGGYDEQIGFTVYDTLRYKTALEALVREEVGMVMDRLAGEVPPERVVEMLEAGAQPLQDLIAALHTKLMVAELERHRARAAGSLVAVRSGRSSPAPRPGSAGRPRCGSTGRLAGLRRGAPGGGRGGAAGGGVGAARAGDPRRHRRGPDRRRGRTVVGRGEREGRARRARQQRRHRGPRPAGDDPDRGLPPPDRGQPDRAGRGHAGDAAAIRARHRPHRLRQLDRRPHGAAVRRPLPRRQVRRSRRSATACARSCGRGGSRSR